MISFRSGVCAPQSLPIILFSFVGAVVGGLLFPLHLHPLLENERSENKAVGLTVRVAGKDGLVILEGL